MRGCCSGEPGNGRHWHLTVGAGLLLSALFGAQASGQQDDIAVTVREGETLREIAEQYLGDPDLWTEILRANDLRSITEIEPGTEIRIPVAQIAGASQALREALQSIQEATQAGARLFAPHLIADALRLRDQAQASRNASAWEESMRLANDAGAVAAEALAAALAERDTLAEALLSDRQGSVEGRQPQDLLWTYRPLNSVLIEEEKVRTLSRSTAQITFRDDSRLRLNANSEAVIQRMRVDPLSRQEEAKVSLVEGDFYALLAGKSERKSFEVEVPQVETQIDSTSFWVRRDVSGSKFTNYDAGVLQVAAAGESVTLGRNEGTVVREGEAPAPKMEVLEAPGLLAPADNTPAFNADLDLRWSPVPEAAGYWLEIASDSAFRRMTLSRWGLNDSSFDAGGLDMGAYYWRVAGLDKFGLPGERSEAWRFEMRADVTPPFLSITAPQEGAILREGPVPVTGESEQGALLELNGAPLALGADGRFGTSFEPQPGLNALVLEATDAAGNVTRRERAFVFVPDERSAAIFDPHLPRLGPRHFITDRDLISLSGETEAAAARILVRTDGGEIRTAAYTDESGRFAINVPLLADEEAFSLQIVAPSGFASEDRFDVTIDREPPEIELDRPPPAVTAIEWLQLSGRAEDAAEVLLNGRPVQMLDDGFDESVTLQHGLNEIEMVANDVVGNVRIERWAIHLDQEPPQLLRHEVSTDNAAGAGRVVVEVAASDASGLTKAAPFSLEVGETVHSDFLEFDRSSGTYRASVVLPQGSQGRVRLRDVELEDYAGNRQRYTFR